MRPVTFGFKTEQSRASYPDLVRIWQEADEIGAFSDLWLFDHFVPLRMDIGDPCHEAWTLLSALAALTRRARIGILVAGNTYRHPAVVANMAATIDHVSGGRLEFGIGAGWHEGEHRMYGIPLGTAGQRIRAMNEACEVVRLLWSNEVSSFDGRFYTLFEARCDPKPVQRPGPPITIGGTGERLTLRVVARHADRWNFNGKSVDEFVRLNAVLDDHCRAVGRDPESIIRSVQVHLGTDSSAIREQVAAYIAAGATHFVLNPRIPLTPGLPGRVARDIVGPLLAGLPGST
ncbi:MAG TPA: TIGR03560 family F420-dependent LLM class oxidoreductase [Gemmatimonadales bacterium]|nr:TIGR03560 family F420-dependent LLM class oxidoreductase [Gemmatimonadales bacterium]